MSCKHEKPCRRCAASRHKHEAKLKKQGMCLRHPSNKALRGTRCKLCITRYERHRKAQKAAGLCVVHPRVRAVKGKTKCTLCLLNTRLSFLRRTGVPKSEVNKAEKAIRKFKGKCQCCRGKQKGFGSGAKRDFSIDHNHITKKFRGIVCAACNLTIGHSRESIERLRRIIVYLQRSHKQ